MKKHKLIKSLMFAPLVSIPLVAASCSSNDDTNGDSQKAAANSLLVKFKADQASNFVSITDSKQKAAYSDFIFSTSKTENKAPDEAYFLDKIKSSKPKTSGDKTTYTYDAAGVPYLYIWANENIQDPDATTKGTPKKMLVLVAEMNESFTVSVKKDAKASDNNGTVTLTGYKSGDEVKEFKMATNDSHFYIANMLYALSVNMNTAPVLPLSIADYKAAVNKITSTSTKFEATATFEKTGVAKLAYDSSKNEITYAPDASDAVFSTAFNNPIKDGSTYVFSNLAYNLDIKTGMLTISVPPAFVQIPI